MDAKRGYVPEDEKNFSPSAVEKLRKASRHIFYLINEGYDLKQASTFVGNHFMLSERQRLAIARSIATSEQLDKRKRKEKLSLDGEEIWVDGFNMVITLEVMLSDSMLFECMDGTIRDLAALRGTYRIIPETEEALHILFDTLKEMNVATVHILLDAPVSNSGRLMALAAGVGENYPFHLDIQLLQDVDRALWEKENVITSDSIILDHCISWLNLMKKCMEKHRVPTIKVYNDGVHYGTPEKEEDTMIIKISDPKEKQQIARGILEALPEWFEVKENREKYIAKSAGWIFLAAREEDEYIGFLCLKETGKDTIELAVMGVLKKYHRKGVGRALFEHAKRTATELGYSFMQVKTVQMGMYEDYDITNRFYLSCGFKEFEVIPELWGEENPCQIYVMSLA